MEIKDKECLPVIHCNVGEVLHIDKGAAMRLMQGDPIHSARVMAEFTYMQTDNKGRVYYTIPLRLVPLRWFLLFLHKIGFRKSTRKWWDCFNQYTVASQKTVNNMILGFKIGVIKHDRADTTP